MNDIDCKFGEPWKVVDCDSDVWFLGNEKAEDNNGNTIIFESDDGFTRRSVVCVTVCVGLELSDNVELGAVKKLVEAARDISLEINHIVEEHPEYHIDIYLLRLNRLLQSALAAFEAKGKKE